MIFLLIYFYKINVRKCSCKNSKKVYDILRYNAYIPFLRTGNLEEFDRQFFEKWLEKFYHFVFLPKLLLPTIFYPSQIIHHFFCRFR